MTVTPSPPGRRERYPVAGQEKPGRATTYRPSIGVKICNGLASGKTLTAICRLPGAPKLATVYEWLWRNVDSSFSEGYARAREIAAHGTFDKIIELEDELLNHERHPNDVRVLIDSMKWRLSRMLPHLYGDRSQVILGGEVAVTERPAAHAPAWIAGLVDVTPKAVEAIDDAETDA